jgi:hypothetical protein
MSGRLLRNTMLAAPAVLAVTAPVAEAATPLHPTPEQRVQILGKSVLALHNGKETVKLSRDRHGRPVATSNVNINLGQTSDSTGDFSFKYVTAAKNGKPELQKPRSLQIIADRTNADGSINQIEMDYSRDSNTQSWKGILNYTHDPPSVPPTENTGIDSASSTQGLIAHSGNPEGEKLFKTFSDFGSLVINDASENLVFSDAQLQQVLQFMDSHSH